MVVVVVVVVVILMVSHSRTFNWTITRKRIAKTKQENVSRILCRREFFGGLYCPSIKFHSGK